MSRRPGPSNVVIVGASLAGLRAAESLRDAGYEGALTLVGEERHRPYDRPPLSKQVLSGWVAPHETDLPRTRAIAADWRLGVRAVALDRRRRAVLLDGGAELPFDRLVIATGARSRAWPVADQAALRGVHLLRTRDDAAALLADLASARRVLVVGAGFTGCEVASACRDRRLAVVCVEFNDAPLLPQLGDLVAGFARDLQVRAGVDLRCSESVTDLLGVGGRFVGARLASGEVLDADVAFVCLGAIRNTEWLAGAGLLTGANGIACDEQGRALNSDGEPDPDIFVCGDAANVPNDLAPQARISVEHWGAAVEQAAAVGANIVAPGSVRLGAVPPRFWSMQFGANIKSVGLPNTADEVMIVQGSMANGRFVALYGREGRTVGAVAVNQAQWLPFYERDVVSGGAFPPAYRVVDAPEDARPRPACFTNDRPAPRAAPALT